MSATGAEILGGVAAVAQAVAGGSAFIGGFKDSTQRQTDELNRQLDPTQADPTAANAVADRRRKNLLKLCFACAVIGFLCTAAALGVLLFASSSQIRPPPQKPRHVSLGGTSQGTMGQHASTGLRMKPTS